MTEKTIKNDELRVYIVDIVPPNFPQEKIQNRLLELESLVTTYKGIVILKSIQKRTQPDYRTYVGSGKLEEIRQEMVANNAKLLIIWNIMKPAQVFAVSELFRKDEIQVWDRIDLILKIFERHATSTEARLQIELAAIHHMGPRIYGMGMELSRQWWGTGWAGGRAGRGIWETNTERMSRHLQEKKMAIKNELKKYQKTRNLHRLGRVRKDMVTVGVVWYTNAGKSALMHSLTGKDILVEDKLFATLGTAVAQMKPPVYKNTVSDDFIEEWDVDTSGQQNEYEKYLQKKILINDTIWFIRDLPPELIEAFRSTLEDSIYSQFLLHVVDVSDIYFDEKIQIVNTILHDIQADQQVVYVFNKIDLLTQEELEKIKNEYNEFNPIFVSAITGVGIDKLKNKIISMSE